MFISLAAVSFLASESSSSTAPNKACTDERGSQGRKENRRSADEKEEQKQQDPATTFANRAKALTRVV
jgi:hypothetical protein